MDVMILGVICSAELLFLIYTWKKYHGEIEVVNQKECALKAFLGSGYYIMDRLKWLFIRKGTNPTVLQYYGRIDYEKRFRLYWGERIALITVAIAASSILALTFAILNHFNKPVSSLERPDFLEGDKEQALFYDLNLGNYTDDDAIKVKIPMNSPTKEELLLAFNQLKEELPSRIKGKNPSLLEVREPLELILVAPESGIEIQWESDNQELLLDNGEIRWNALGGESETVHLTARLTYGEVWDSVIYAVCINQREYTDQEKARMIKEELAFLLDYDRLKGSSDEVVQLPPETFDHKGELSWFERARKSNPFSVLLIGIGSGFLLQLLKKKDLEIRIRRREEALRRSFPGWLNKFTLLLNAGMTFSKAFEKIAEDYVVYKMQYGLTDDLYEEMLVSLEDIQKGYSEIKAIEGIGLRTKLPELLRFSSAVTQNIKKGGQLLRVVLEQQAKEALKAREDLARKKGEKAGTKLILPMGIMLIAILLVVMTPAILLFNL